MTYLDRMVLLISIILVVGMGGLWYWEDSIKLPDFSDETFYYIGTQEGEAGRLLAYDPEIAEPYSLTRPGFVVNEYLLHQPRRGEKSIYYLSVPKKFFSQQYIINRHQKLMHLDLNTGKRRTISPPKDAELSSLYPEVVNNHLYFESNGNLWRYDLVNNLWKSLYFERPLQDIQLSSASQLLLAADASENFVYNLLKLQESDWESPVGNYYQNFGFSPDGTKFLLTQKPDQDIFNSQSFFTLFSADGTSQDFLKDRGETIQALWKSDQEILVLLRDRDLVDVVGMINLEDPENFVPLTSEAALKWIGHTGEKLWLVAEEKTAVEQNDLDYDTMEGIDVLLDAFVGMKKKYTIWSYDFEMEDLISWPVEGFYPRSF